jgi:nucleotide-binding universal stress UspA family protein
MASTSMRADTSAPFHNAGSESKRDVGRLVPTASHTKTEQFSSDTPLVVLLLDPSSTSVAIRRASNVATALNARLEVILAIPEGTAERHPSLISAHASDLLAALRPRRDFTFEIVHGNALEMAAEMASNRDAELVIVDAAYGSRAATRLVEKTGIPVLIARDPRATGELVAASDMRDRQLPVLRFARDYADALDRKITFLHNAKPMPVFISDPMAGPATYTGMLEMQDSIASARAARLRTFAGRDELSTLVSRSASTPDAILELAQFHEADLIVLGHRRRSWISRLVSRGVAEEVAERSSCSVLVVPVKESRS